MSINKRLFVGSTAATGAAECTTDTADIFGDSSGKALYSLDYDYTDASGNYDFTASNNVTFGHIGNINYAADFSGTTSTISGTTLKSRYKGSFAFWIKTSTTATNMIMVDTSRASSSNRGTFIGFDTLNKLRLYVAGGSSGNVSVDLRSTNAHNDGEWHHVVANWDAIDTNSSEIFVDGVSDGSGGCIQRNWTTSNESTGTVLLGGYSASGYNYNGLLDQLRIFDRPLTQGEVDTLYAEQRCVYTSTTDNNALGGTNVAYYKLDGDATDETTNNYDGTEANITYAFGRYGTAASFDGASDVITVTSTATTPIDPSGSFSISLWVFHDDLDGHQTYVSKYGASGYLQSYIFGLDDSTNKPRLVEGTGSGFNARLANTALVANRWYHLVVTANSSQVVFYIDGELDRTISRTQTRITGGTQDTTIGKRATVTSQTLDGKIDQIRLFSEVVDSDDVDALYAERQEQITLNSTDPYDDDDCIAYYKLDNNVEDALDTYDGTNNSVTFSTDRLFGTHSASFNGSSSYFYRDGIFASNPSAMSASLWYKTTADGNLLDIGDNSVSTAQNRIFFASSNLYVSINGGGGGFASFSSSGLKDDNWHHIVAIWDDGSVTNGIKLYVDGLLKAQANSTQSFNAAKDLFVGANDNRSGSSPNNVIRQYFNGEIDQVRIFDRTLESDEVFQLYSEAVLDE